MSVKASHRGPAGQNFNTTYPDDLQEIYVDGVGELMLGVSNCKLTLFQTRVTQTPEIAKTGDPIEERQAVLVLSMNLGTFIETFGKVLATIGQNTEQIRSVLDKQRDATFALLDGLASSSIPVDTTAIKIM